MSERLPCAQDGQQLAFLAADWCPEVFYGGERGGGKSYAHCLYQADGALRYGKAWSGIMVRKTYPELEDLQAKAQSVFPAYRAIYATQPSADRPFSNAWYFPTGAVVRMRYLEREDDYLRYHGHSFTGVSLDEVTEYATPDGLLKMISTLRSAEGVPCTLRATGNPGGIGHGWVKARYIDPVPPMTVFADPESGIGRMFIPSRLDDNQILVKTDPGYRSRIIAATSGNEALRKAWLDGNWDIVAGAFFSGWDRAKHVIPTTSVPEHWVKGMGFDWGSRAPYAAYWGAVSDGETEVGGRIYPRGAVLVSREQYGMQPGQYNVGLELDAEEVAERILAASQEKLDFLKADPSIFRRDGGPSIAERMGNRKLYFAPADNSRVAGADQVRGRLNGDDGVPMLYIMDTCVHLIRTLPLLQVDKHKVEDVETDSEDHCYDALRYFLMGRPWHRKPKAEPAKVLVHTGWTFKQLREANLRRERRA